MGIDLSLLPETGKNSNLSNDILEFHRDSDLFELIEELANKKGIDVRRGGIKSFLGSKTEDGHTCYGKTEIDKYGNRIKSVLAGELHEICRAYRTESWKNAAIFAFIEQMPEDLPIYLFWH